MAVANSYSGVFIIEKFLSIKGWRSDCPIHLRRMEILDLSLILTRNLIKMLGIHINCIIFFANFYRHFDGFELTL
jgi:hypothetical protein